MEIGITGTDDPVKRDLLALSLTSRLQRSMGECGVHSGTHLAVRSIFGHSMSAERALKGLWITENLFDLLRVSESCAGSWSACPPTAESSPIWEPPVWCGLNRAAGPESSRSEMPIR